MRKVLLFLLLLFTPPGRGENVSTKRLVPVANAQAAGVFEETLSPDHRYAIGWTILVKNPGASPVQWITWNPDSNDNFVALYGSDDYELTNGVIDIKGKAFLALPSDDPNIPPKNRGYTVAAWSPEKHGVRYALVQNDARFYTENLWLITIDASGMHQQDLAGELAKALGPLLRTKRTVSVDEYGTLVKLKDDASGRSMVSFEGDTATFPFETDIPKSLLESSVIKGTVTVHLPEAKVIKTSSDTPVDDPFVSNPELAKMDSDLNAVYLKLWKSLNAGDQAALKTEQLAWLKQRDQNATETLLQPSDKYGNDLRAARNASLLDDTKKRLEDLRARLR
jgi:uncharacterized protein YecT (DUF1311 family)